MNDIFFKLDDGDILNINDIMAVGIIPQTEHNDDKYFCKFRMRTYSYKFGWGWEIFGTRSDYNRFCEVYNA